MTSGALPEIQPRRNPTRPPAFRFLRKSPDPKTLNFAPTNAELTRVRGAEKRIRPPHPFRRTEGKGGLMGGETDWAGPRSRGAQRLARESIRLASERRAQCQNGVMVLS